MDKAREVTEGGSAGRLSNFPKEKRPNSPIIGQAWHSGKTQPNSSLFPIIPPSIDVRSRHK